MKGAYYVADCWVSNDELEVWFDTNANWVMTENELNSIDQLVPAVYTAFMDSKYNAWVVTDVYVLTFPQNPMESCLHGASRRKTLLSCCRIRGSGTASFD